MLTQISEWAELDQNTILLDLCCGTGVIGIALSPYVKKVIGIEMIESAVEDCI
jgi:tRNA (uracil-5-)-methyltransferase